MMIDMIFRPAIPADITAMSLLLEELIAVGKRKSAADAGFVKANYVANPNGIACTVAEDPDGAILGFQSLIHAEEGNRFGVQVGWGIIGTHVSPRAARRGIGKGLWAASLQAARATGLQNIDATISDDNTEGLAYYEAVGFRTYRTTEGAICKVFTLPT